MVSCDKCNKKATRRYYYLSKPNEFFFCDDHSMLFQEDMRSVDIDYIQGTL